MPKPKRSEMSLAEIRALLESGMILRRVHALCGYTVSELSLMCKLWNIPRNQGRPRKDAR
jgi:hypothetical protein